MATGPFTLIDETHASTVDATLDGERVRLSPDTVRAALGWELKPEGLCKGAVCVPVGRRSDVVDKTGIDLAAFASLLDRPLALDAAERAGCLGASAADRSARLASLVAPDFTLPDLEGNLHSLSDQRGKKVLLIAYASW